MKRFESSEKTYLLTFIVFVLHLRLENLANSLEWCTLINGLRIKNRYRVRKGTNQYPYTVEETCAILRTF